MIIRKPYAFLIKNFKKIHLFLAALLIYITFKSQSILNTITLLSQGNMNRYSAENYVNYGLFVPILLTVILLGFIYYLMRHKKKPKLIYILSILGCILLTVLLIIIFNYFIILKSELINQKTIRLYRDIFRILIVFEYIIDVIMLVRGLGFDIKKFDFKKDLQELNISEEDAEEVEVNVNINTDSLFRRFRKLLRELKYYFFENKLVISIILGVVIIITSFSLYNTIGKYNKYYDVFEYFNTGNYTMKINGSYITNLGYNNSKLDDYYVIVSFDIKGNLNYKSSVNDAKFQLKIGRNKYYPDKNNCLKFIDFGACYKNKTISNDTIKNYILVYKIKEIDKDRKATFIYNYGNLNGNDLNVKVKLNIYNAYSINNDSKYTVGNKLNLNDTVFGSGNLTVTNVNVGQQLTIDTNCSENDNCVINTSSDNKTLIMIDINTDISDIFNSRLFKYYGKLLDGEDNILDYKIIKNKDNKKYILEVDKSAEASSSLYFKFALRNKKIMYSLKED